MGDDVNGKGSQDKIQQDVEACGKYTVRLWCKTTINQHSPFLYGKYLKLYFNYYQIYIYNFNFI